jgi:hypothetical protein
MVSVMDNIAKSAHELQRAAGWFQKRASDPGAVAALPAALAHTEEALDRLATALVKASHAVEDVEAQSGAEGVLCPPAEALRWHLCHVSALLRGAGDACPATRRWARALLADPTGDAAPAWSRGRAPMQSRADGAAAAR